MKSDPKAECAAAKVRRTAERPLDDHASEHEKNQEAQDTVEANAELERSKHYKGNPPRNA
jgi:hypothetical protein